ncbi:methyltransferase domain-containing protein [Escherichia coli]|nr:methyltransferase domain-containing protein [Escherichia coli]EFG8200335.1 methyltransferase domain-containing protein [Escherichia coli]
MDIQKQVLNGVHNAAVFKRRVRVLSTLLAAEMQSGESVLDVGCGDGSIAVAIQSHAPHLTFSGIDVFLRPQVAIPAVVYDGITIPHADNSFDWVTIVDVLHHTDDPSVVLAECARVARKGVVIKDHLREGVAAGQTLRFMDWVGNRGHDVRLPYNYLSKAEWHAIFDKIGAKVLTWNEQLGLYPQPFSMAFDRGLHFIGAIRKTVN